MIKWGDSPSNSIRAIWEEGFCLQYKNMVDFLYREPADIELQVENPKVQAFLWKNDPLVDEENLTWRDAEQIAHDMENILKDIQIPPAHDSSSSLGNPCLVRFDFAFRNIILQYNEATPHESVAVILD